MPTSPFPAKLVLTEESEVASSAPLDISVRACSITGPLILYPLQMMVG